MLRHLPKLRVEVPIAGAASSALRHLRPPRVLVREPARRWYPRQPMNGDRATIIANEIDLPLPLRFVPTRDDLADSL